MGKGRYIVWGRKHMTFCFIINKGLSHSKNYKVEFTILNPCRIFLKSNKACYNFVYSMVWTGNNFKLSCIFDSNK